MLLLLIGSIMIAIIFTMLIHSLIHELAIDKSWCMECKGPVERWKENRWRWTHVDDWGEYLSQDHKAQPE